MKKPQSDRNVLRRAEAPEPVARIDRQGKFPQRADVLSLLVSRAIGQARPDLSTGVHIGEPMMLVAKSGGAKNWTLAFKQEPDGMTDVTLENVTATPAELDEIWRIIADCAQLR